MLNLFSKNNIPKDIIVKIKEDFGPNTDLVLDLIKKAIKKHDYIKTPRVIRCVIHLSNKDLEKFKESLNQAITDPRDVMFWAEYTRQENEESKRIKDFNEPFKN